MLMVQNDWIQYEETRPVRRTAVRGGAACAQRMPVVRQRPATAPARSAAGSRTVQPEPKRLRLTRRGRVVLVVLPALAALSAALVAAGPAGAQAAPQPAHHAAVIPVSLSGR